MKKNILPAGVFIIILLVLWTYKTSAQKNKYIPVDSSLSIASEPWKVKQHKGLFGMGKPAFGPFITLQTAKLDSPMIKRKTKEGKEFTVEFSSEGTDMDLSKIETIEKTKFYKLLLAKETDTSEIVFSVHSSSKGKKQTFVGAMLSKDDEEKNSVLNYKRKVSGMISTGFDSILWRFYVDDYVTDRTITASNPWNSKDKTPEITGGYIKNENDSLFTEPIMHTVGSQKDKFFASWQTGLSVKNNNGVHLAACQFAGGMQPAFYIWMRKDLDDSYKEAVASLFAVIIAIMGL